jgi:hypothetical protein
MLRKTIRRATRELAGPMNSCFIRAALREVLRIGSSVGVIPAKAHRR